MNSKPLTYDSLKTVLQYMDPNTRFLLSSRIPSIRIAEKEVPLRIYELSFGFGHCISVNKTDYEIALYQMDCKDKIPYLISGTSKLSSRMTCNVDKFGTRDYITKAGGMLPGDIGKNFFGYDDREIISTNEGRLQKLETIIEIEKQRLNQLLNYRPENNSIEEDEEILSFFFEVKLIRTDVLRLYKKEELEFLKNEEMVRKAIKHMKDRVKEMENELVLFRNKSNNICPKFEIHIVKCQEDSPPRVIERINYTGDLHKAEESLRECPLRLPTDSRIKIKDLTIGRSSTSNIKLMKSIVDNSSLPVERLEVSVKDDNPELDYEFLGNSKYLKLNLPTNLNSCIKNLRNKRVDFTAIGSSFFKNEEFIVLIKNWVETNKPIGTYFSFNVVIKESDAIQVLNRVRDRFDGATAGDKYVNIPMRVSAFLKIDYNPTAIFNWLPFRLRVLPAE